MAEHEQEKTETATPRRRQEAREEGNVARSTDLTAAAMLVAAVVLLYVFGRTMFDGMRLALLRSLRFEPGSNGARAEDVESLLAFSGQITLEMLWPYVVGVALVGVVAMLGQIGFLWTAKPLQPNFGRLSPLRGVQNLLDARAVVRLSMGLAKIALIVAVVAVVLMQEAPRVIALAQLSAETLLSAAGGIVFRLSLKLAVLLLVLAVLDYAFQYWKRERDLRMTRQEVREEMKRMEGDPLIKQRRTRVARQLALQRIGLAVPKADVIVTNPTHYAVALRYESGTMKAPKVIAKGADFLAARIRQLAAVHGVPMVERRELAQALYRSVEVGREVPPQFYAAVAEILAYVYRLSGRKSA